MTVAFFALLPHIPWQRELLMRYCSAHPIEICSMTLFFIGTGVYIRKLIALSREKKALRETTYALASVSRIEGNEMRGLMPRTDCVTLSIFTDTARTEIFAST